MVEYEMVSLWEEAGEMKKMRNPDKLLLRACRSLRSVFHYLKAALIEQGFTLWGRRTILKQAIVCLTILLSALILF